MGLDRVRAALAAIPADQLRALIGAVRQAPNVPPSLLAWLEHAALAELDTRAGRQSSLRNPLRLVDPADIPRSLLALAALAAHFARAGDAQVAGLLNAAGECLRPSPTVH